MKTTRSGYWLQCQRKICKYEGAEYWTVTGCNSAAAYIWDKVSKKWDQSLLLMICPKCKRRSLRITYAFPRREDREVVQVIHVVGIRLGDNYTPMMWESRPISRPKLQWFQFNYLSGRGPFGLKAPAVLSYAEIRRLFALYRSKTGKQLKTR
jgi:hypothetical protein